MDPITLGVGVAALVAWAFSSGCSKEYIRYEKKGGVSSPPPKKGPKDPCPGKECAGADETKGKGINGSAWVEGKPTVTGDSVGIGTSTIDTSKSVYSVKELASGTDLGFKVTTNIPRRAFLFASGQSTPANQNVFNRTIAELGGFLLKANSKRYACYLPTTDNSATIYISGHTDRTGSDQTNERLSKERAETVAKAVFEFLSKEADKSDFDPVTIKSIGMGEKMAAEAGRRDSVANDADRRVDVVTSSTGAPFEGNWQEVDKVNPINSK